MAQPAKEFFANLKMRSHLIDAVMNESDIGRIRAGMQVRNFENTHPEDLAFAAGTDPHLFKAGVYVAALAHVGCEHASAIVAMTNSVGAIGDGTFLQKLQEMFANLMTWLSDPANQAKIMAAIKFLMTIFAMFGA